MPWYEIRSARDISIAGSPGPGGRSGPTETTGVRRRERAARRDETARAHRIFALAWARGCRQRSPPPSCIKSSQTAPASLPSQCATLTHQRNQSEARPATRCSARRDGFWLRRAARALGGAEEARALPARAAPLPPGTHLPITPTFRACAIARLRVQICGLSGQAAPDPALPSGRIGLFRRRWFPRFTVHLLLICLLGIRPQCVSQYQLSQTDVAFVAETGSELNVACCCQKKNVACEPRRCPVF